VEEENGFYVDIFFNFHFTEITNESLELGMENVCRYVSKKHIHHILHEISDLYSRRYHQFLWPVITSVFFLTWYIPVGISNESTTKHVHIQSTHNTLFWSNWPHVSALYPSHLQAIPQPMGRKLLITTITIRRILLYKRIIYLCISIHTVVASIYTL
jgi:hypothetical protein